MCLVYAYTVVTKDNKVFKNYVGEVAGSHSNIVAGEVKMTLKSICLIVSGYGD